MRGRNAVTTTLGAKTFFPMLAALVLTLALSPLAAAANPPMTPGAGISASAQIDWNKIDAEALPYFQSYLRFDTSNPPDDTSAAIAFLKQILDKEGIETQVFVSKPGMANLVARLP